MILPLLKKSSKYKYIIYYIFIFWGIICRHRGCVMKLSDIMIVLPIHNISSENFFLCIKQLQAQNTISWKVTYIFLC